MSSINPGVPYAGGPATAVPPTGKRPWYKKKRSWLLIIIGLFILLFAGCAALIGAVSSSDTVQDAAASATQTVDPTEPVPDAASEPAPSEEVSEAPTAAEEPVPEEPAAPGIGTPVTDGKFEFTVTRVERPGNTIGEEPFQETAQGEYVIVYVNVTNIGDEAQTLSSSGQTITDDQGRELDSSSDGLFALEGASDLFLEAINPGNSVTDAPLLYDVAPGSVLESITLHDSIFSGGTTVSLAGA